MGEKRQKLANLGYIKSGYRETSGDFCLGLTKRLLRDYDLFCLGFGKANPSKPFRDLGLVVWARNPGSAGA